MAIAADTEQAQKPARSKGYRPPYAELTGSDRVPLWAWPPKPLACLKFIFGFPGLLFPFVAIYAVLALVQWTFLLPDQGEMQHPGSWIGLLWLQNAVLLTVWVAPIHYLLYVKKAQGTEYKYSPSWPVPSSTFLFNSQVKDNIFWSIVSGVTVWTAYMATALWLFSSNIIMPLSFDDHPVYFMLLFPLLLLWHTVHFYVQHRLVHTKWLWRFHALHHRNITPGPWSGLSMSPVEHIIYMSSVVILWIIPSHPIHSIFMLIMIAIGPALSHSGFEVVKIGGRWRLVAGDFDHELHHKLVSVNFTVSLIPLDHWFGTFCDGSAASMRKVQKRLKK